MKKQDIEEFVSFVKNDLYGDERGQAQTFCDRLFRAYGQKGIYEAQGKLEARIKIADTNTTNYIDCLWSPPGKDGVLIEMKKKESICYSMQL